MTIRQPQQLRVHQNPYSRIEAPFGGYVIAASLDSTPWKDAVRLTCASAGPLLLSYVKTEWYTAGLRLLVTPEGMLQLVRRYE